MKSIEFYDGDGQSIRLQHSSSTTEAYRIYLELNDVKPKIDKVTQEPIPQCIHLTRNQAEMLINGLQDLFLDNDSL